MPSNRAIFLKLLDDQLRDDAIRVADADGEVTVGPESRGAEPLTLEVHRPRFYRRVLVAGNLGMGEAFMDGDFDVARGALPGLLEVLLRNRLDRNLTLSPRATVQVAAMRLVDAVRGKAANVQRHYDLGDDLFEAFLDETLTYSCGYARQPDDDLESLQRQKMERICRKLRLVAGERLLDIGCGFGALLRHAAEHHGVRGVGVTVSRRHAERGRQLVDQAGLAERVTIHYADYGEVVGRFEKVVSVGMLEHVPRREYGRYFATLRRALTADGLGLVHAVGANAPRNVHDPFIQRYIFPSSNQPRLSEIAAHLERRGLAILDVENMIRHYRPTAERWLERFLSHRAELDPARYDARFCRMWEYYLSCCVAAATASDAALYQVLFSADHTAPQPLERV